MNITSCGHCGVLLDVDTLNWPDLTRVDSTSDNSEYVGGASGFVPKVSCPVCHNDVLFPH